MDFIINSEHFYITDEVFKKLQIIPRLSFPYEQTEIEAGSASGVEEEEEVSEEDWTWKVFLPNSNFKKTKPGVPFSIVFCIRYAA